MTPAEWLRARAAAAPPPLRERALAIVAESPLRGEPAGALADAAVNALQRLLEAGDQSRAVASDLLAIDALVTWSCEAAIERWRDGDQAVANLLAWCDSLARRIAAVAAHAPSATR